MSTPTLGTIISPGSNKIMCWSHVSQDHRKQVVIGNDISYLRVGMTERESSCPSRVSESSVGHCPRAGGQVGTCTTLHRVCLPTHVH